MVVGVQSIAGSVASCKSAYCKLYTGSIWNLKSSNKGQYMKDYSEVLWVFRSLVKKRFLVLLIIMNESLPAAIGEATEKEMKGSTNE